MGFELRKYGQLTNPLQGVAFAASVAEGRPLPEKKSTSPPQYSTVLLYF